MTREKKNTVPRMHAQNTALRKHLCVMLVRSAISATSPVAIPVTHAVELGLFKTSTSIEAYEPQPMRSAKSTTKYP
jgi:hypothetical protein